MKFSAGDLFKVFLGPDFFLEVANVTGATIPKSKHRLVNILISHVFFFIPDVCWCRRGFRLYTLKTQPQPPKDTTRTLKTQRTACYSRVSGYMSAHLAHVKGAPVKQNSMQSFILLILSLFNTFIRSKVRTYVRRYLRTALRTKLTLIT